MFNSSPDRTTNLKKDNEIPNLLRKNFPRGRLGKGSEFKGKLDPTIYQSTNHCGILEMQRKISRKKNNPQAKCPSSTSTRNNMKKFFGVRSIEENNKHVWFNDQGIFKGAVETKAAFAIIFICTISSAMARPQDPATFFPRLQYHKSFVRVPRLTFGSNNGDRGSVPFVNHPNFRHNDLSSQPHQKTATKLSPTANLLSGMRGLKTKPTSIYPSGGFASLHNPDEEANQMGRLEIEEPANDAVEKSDDEEVIDLSMMENLPDTASMSKKSSDLFTALESAYDTSDVNKIEDINNQESLMNSHVFPPLMGSPDLPPLIRPQKVNSQGQRPNYNSWNTYNPGQFKENSPEWQMAMLHYLIDMKMNGHKIQEVSVDEPLPTLHRKLTQKNQLTGNLKEPESIESELEGEIPSYEKANTVDNPMVPPGFPVLPGDDPVICKLEPYNICYRFDEQGNLHPLGARRPVRLIRIYK